MGGDTPCFSGLWGMAQIFFAVSFGILSLFPLLTWYLLWKLRKSPKERREKYPALVCTYREKRWFYESIMMARRIVLLLVYAFPKTQQLLLRGIITFFCTVILLIHARVQPFKERCNNILETILLLLLCLISTLTTISTQDSSIYITHAITVLSAL